MTLCYLMVAGGAEVSSASIFKSREYKIARDSYMAVVENSKIRFNTV